jgi:hypothetical protein
MNLKDEIKKILSEELVPLTDDEIKGEAMMEKFFTKMISGLYTVGSGGVELTKIKYPDKTTKKFKTIYFRLNDEEGTSLYDFAVKNKANVKPTKRYKLGVGGVFKVYDKFFLRIKRRTEKQLKRTDGDDMVWQVKLFVDENKHR